MYKLIVTLVCAVALGLLGACAQEEPENYGSIPKDTLDKVTKEAEAATQEVKEKVDKALQQLE